MAVGQKPDYNIAGLPEIHYNPLQQYRSVTYNMRLTAMPATEAKATRLERSYDHNKGIVLFETGGTGTINLEELTMETVGTGNKSGNYMMAQPIVFRGRLIEPVGGRLIEAVSLTSYKLGYPDNQSAVYLLEIWFVGYNDDDQPVICRGWDDEPMEFRYYVTLQQLKMQLDYRGSVYEIEMVPSTAKGALGDYMNLEQGFRMTANPATIGDFCKNLTDALNKREEQKVKDGYRCYPHKYVITAHKKIRDMKFDYSFWSRGNWSWGQNTGETQVEAGTTLQRFITNTVANSKELFKYLHRVDDGKKDYNSPDTKPGSIGKGAPRSVSIIVGSKLQQQGDKILFDNKLNGSVEEVHVFVTTKEDGKLVISPQEYEDARNSGFRSDRIQRWIDLGLLRKVYKWIYTGENTEVLGANIKIDNLWRIVRPLWISSETGQPAPTGSRLPPAKETAAGKNTSSTIKCDEARKVNAYESDGTVLYSEDLPFRQGEADRGNVSPNADWLPNLPRFYHANTQIQQAQAQSAFFEESAHEYSVFRQIHSQVGAGSSDLVTLELEVLGDPYWLMQIPNTSGKYPWEEDVWEYEKEQWDDETLAEKRKNSSTHNWLPFLYFEAQVPSVNLNGEDIMDLRNSDSITGIYGVKKVVNSFVKGKFSTKLECFRDPLGNPWVNRDKKTSAKTGEQSVNSGQATSTGPRSAQTPTGEQGGGNLGVSGA